MRSFLGQKSGDTIPLNHLNQYGDRQRIGPDMVAQICSTKFGSGSVFQTFFNGFKNAKKSGVLPSSFFLITYIGHQTFHDI